MYATDAKVFVGLCRLFIGLRNSGATVAPPHLVRICFSKKTPFTLYPRPQGPRQMAKAEAKVTATETANSLITFLVVFFIFRLILWNWTSSFSKFFHFEFWREGGPNLGPPIWQ